MRFSEITEGGWDSVVTQGTVIRPSTVKKALTTMQKFINDFNSYSKEKNIPAIKIGYPTGSSAYYQVDPEDTIYGDIDLQIVVPEVQGKSDMTSGQVQYYWYQLFNDFIKTKKPNYVHPETKNPGHPIVKIGKNSWVQVDLMPHPEPLAQWGRFRSTPERGVKGLLNGNMFAVLGKMLNLNLQHAGVLYKEQNGVRAPYPTTKNDYELKKITTNIQTFVRDIFDHEYKDIVGKDPKTAQVDPLLIKHPGSNVEEVKISNLVNAVKGLARSFEQNNMYGKRHLSDYSSADDFLNKFLEIYMAMAQGAINSPKRDKAETPEAKARAEQDKKSIAQGAAMVQKLFTNND